MVLCDIKFRAMERYEANGGNLLFTMSERESSHCFVQTRRRTGLWSLVLDGCGIRSLSRESVQALYGITKLSLSYTRITNLWSTVTALQPLELKQLCFQEPFKSMPVSAATFQCSKTAKSPRTTLDDCCIFSLPTKSNSCFVSKMRLDSPVCREKAYRAFLISRLKSLEVLDGTEVSNFILLYVVTPQDFFYTVRA